MSRHNIYVITLVIAIIGAAACLPAENAKRKQKYPATFQSPSNMSYEELLFILKTRHNGLDVKPPKTFSPCARAILGCCKDKKIKEKCSEDLGCGSFFFDDNPCEDAFVIDALKAARVFYRQFFEA